MWRNSDFIICERKLFAYLLSVWSGYSGDWYYYIMYIWRKQVFILSLIAFSGNVNNVYHNRLESPMYSWTGFLLDNIFIYVTTWNWSLFDSLPVTGMPANLWNVRSDSPNCLAHSWLVTSCCLYGVFVMYPKCWRYSCNW